MPDAVRDLPEPREFGRVLRERLEAEIVRVRAERGTVTTPEDVFQLTRGLARYIELAGEYQHAFQHTVLIAKQELANELADAVGEQDGVPLNGLTVPDLDGTDVALTLDAPNTHHIDTEELPAVVAAVVLTDTALYDIVELASSVAIGAEDRSALETYLADRIVDGITAHAELGLFKPQVTKVRSFAKHLAGQGWDQLAAVVSRTIRTTTEFKGIKINRKERK